MSTSRRNSRRRFLLESASAGSLAALTIGSRPALAAPTPAEDARELLKVGVATYTFSRLPLDKTLPILKKLDVHYCSIKESHLPLKSSEAERKDVVAKFKAAGVTPLSCGNVSMKGSESELRNAFEYARDCGIPVIVCAPTKAVMPSLEKLVKEFDIKLAIHNHGPEDKIWPTPYEPYEFVKSMDPRIGLCIDVGHTRRAGADPAEAIRKCADRVYDIHIKDINGTAANARPIELGRGALDLAAILKALIDIKFQHHVGLEYEKDMADPTVGAAESLGYIKGLLARGF